MKCVKPNAFANAEDHDAGDVDDQLDDIKVAQPGQKNKTRHRASVACCSCRDRRIRVCSDYLDQIFFWLEGVLIRLFSALYHRGTPNAPNASVPGLIV